MGPGSRIYERLDLDIDERSERQIMFDRAKLVIKSWINVFLGRVQDPLIGLEALHAKRLSSIKSELALLLAVEAEFIEKIKIEEDKLSDFEIAGGASDELTALKDDLSKLQTEITVAQELLKFQTRSNIPVPEELST